MTMHGRPAVDDPLYETHLFDGYMSTNTVVLARIPCRTEWLVGWGGAVRGDQAAEGAVLYRVPEGGGLLLAMSTFKEPKGRPSDRSRVRAWRLYRAKIRSSCWVSPRATTSRMSDASKRAASVEH